ncbi:hypothetical protein Patl1_04571 [Pistacia atlantica]|uniref:Uncharacterized protein n=1 Tax=Pistacia atlantica TaxID=434234 RepID=A0ACC1BTL4_9ROSI|nr:hypothetical protein Patl1_04571 [Pistacia atlantica]
MAFSLSSPTLTFSHNLFFTFSTTPNRNILSARFTFPLSRKQSARFGHLKVQCKSKQDDTTELEYWRSIPTKLCISAFGNGMKTAKTLIAAIFIFVQISSPLCMIGWELWSVSPAKAVLYSPDTKVPRTGELALRRAIPANTNMKAITGFFGGHIIFAKDSSEKTLWNHGGSGVSPFRLSCGFTILLFLLPITIATDEKDSILASIPTDLKEKGSEMYASLIDGKGGLQALLKCIKDQDPDKVSVGPCSISGYCCRIGVATGKCRLCEHVKYLTEHCLQQAPGLSFLLPEQYLKYPRLTGRGAVELTIEKGDGSSFSPEAGGEQRKTATIQVVLDGYSAPLTAGNIAKLVRFLRNFQVIDGAYDGTRLSCTEQAILTDSGLDKNSGYSVPLEIKPSGQFEPLYKTTLSVQDGELPVLPLSVYGAVGMAHSDVSEEYSAPYQFFFYLYDKRNAGLGGLSFDEGQFSVFG